MSAFRGDRSVKRLQAVADASKHQRAWFAEVHERVAQGEPLALVDAEAPHEILRALDIPYVVIQWWASVCSAKQRAPHYLSLLHDRGYPDDSSQYNAIPLGSALAGDGEEEPWGGLPRVSFVVSQVHSATHRRIGEAWSRETGATFLPVESAVQEQVPARWWERIPHEWEDVVGARRLDLMTAEFEGLVERLEGITGRRFDLDRFARVMALANEHAGWNRKTRDLLARAVPAPIDIADSIPAVMLPQWHRGSEWGRDAARAFHDEVAGLVARGDALCPDERVRLMWIGRGLWFNLGFYQHFQERYGAVFVWSMYLAIAADGYPRHGGEPLRALAARFAPFAEFLGMPGWANDWYLKEARLHAVDGVVNLVAPESRSSYFVTRTLEAAGIPVLEIDANNADARDWDERQFVTELSRFIEGRVDPVAARRRCSEQRSTLASEGSGS